MTRVLNIIFKMFAIMVNKTYQYSVIVNINVLQFNVGDVISSNSAIHSQ